MKFAHLGLAGALSNALVSDAASAPQGAQSRLLDRASAWTHLQNGIAAQRAPESKPEAAADETLLSLYAPRSCTWRVEEPPGIYRLAFDGELLRLPEDFAFRLEAARAVEMVFECATGGSVSIADEILRTLTASKKPVNAHVVEFATSAHAELFALTPGRRTMAPGAKLMLHAARSVLFATAEGLESEARRLREIDESAAHRLAERTSRPLTEVREWLRPGQQSWFSAEDAVALGLADSICPAVPAGDGSLAPSPAL